LGACADVSSKPRLQAGLCMCRAYQRLQCVTSHFAESSVEAANTSGVGVARVRMASLLAVGLPLCGVSK